MYIYNMGYYSHEESEYTQLYHEDKFSEQEFEEIIMKSATKILDGENVENTSFQDIYHEVVEELINSFGFKKVEFEAEFSIFGWPKIGNKDEWKGARGELLDKLADFIKTKGNKPK